MGSRFVEPEHPTKWCLCGFGTPTFAALFKDTLRATVDARIALSFALGTNHVGGAEPVSSLHTFAGMSYSRRRRSGLC